MNFWAVTVFGWPGRWFNYLPGSNEDFTVQEMREFLTPAMTIAQKAQITGGLLTLFVAVWVFKKMRTSIPH